MSDNHKKKRHKKRLKKKRSREFRDIQLNIMPFIDVFSLLNTFLLMSAVFLSVGILEVQIPFLTSAPPEKQTDTKSCDVKVDMDKERIEVTATDCGTEEKKQFQINATGITDMHKHLVAIRRTNVETDKLQLFTDDEVIWKDIAKVLDAIKLRAQGDPVFQAKGNSDVEKAMAAEFLFPKVVMASVML